MTEATRIRLTPKQRRQTKKELLAPYAGLKIDDHWTICNHLRCLYRTSLTDFQKELCEEIAYMARRMAKRLLEYRDKYGKISDDLGFGNL